jgi:hypothetical protein
MIPFPSPALRGRTLLGAALILAACGLSACQADYAADITNRTPQPIRANIFRKGGGDNAVLGASRRLGPGDRMLVGPVRTSKDYGAFLSVDSMGNPTRPLTTDLPRGTVYLVIEQDGQGPDAPLRIVEKP